MFYQGKERYEFRRQIDIRKLEYTYQWIDFQAASRGSYFESDRKEYIKEKTIKIYPDTLVWIRDFTYSYNEPMTRQYFYHPKYDDYPVVGVSWHQANAFCNWRTRWLNRYWESQEMPITEYFRLPTEYEWEFAARGGRDNNMYPWGGPYTRNSKGCLLANFKPNRGNYMSDGGLYPVRADSYFPNDYGLYNMAGNVAEWTISAYDESSHQFTHDLNSDYQVDAEDDGPLSLKRKVTRGGSWKDVAYFIQNGSRSYEYQDTSKSYVGFRCVQTYIGRSATDRR
jgi:sulfatase modifying factor 1